MNDIARIVPWWIALGLTGLGSWQSQAADRTDRQLEEAPDKVARSKQHLEATRRQVEQDHDSALPLVAARRELADSKPALDAYGDRVMGIALGLTGLGSWQSQAADRTDRQLEEAQDKVARSKEHLEATRRRVEQDHDSAPPLVAARRELADSKTALDAYGDRVMAELRQRRDYQEALTRLHWFEKEFSRMQESGGKTADPVRLGDELSQAIMTEWRLKKVARGPAGEIAEQKVSKAERQLNELIRQRDEAVRKDPRLAQSTRELDAANSALAAALPRFDTLTNSIGMKLILIPNGEFLMGSPDSDRDSRDDEKPQHLVRITVPFYLGVYEVTQAEYEQIVCLPGGDDDAVQFWGCVER
ncbi:MAG: SUMF1/EgtB/PvdO family nonheme iron enzyme [Planctomycetota bacterium]|nr:SUMF1/EgtB/PvdO family nonheme iron enzyme [Planctomycetota bacterium]